MQSISGLPETYEELYIHYWDLIKATVRRVGIFEQDVEDVSVELFILFMQKDGLKYYDHDRLCVTVEQGKKKVSATFPKMLKGFVSTYAMQYRDKQYTQRSKEPIHCEQPHAYDTWIDNHAPAVQDYHEFEYVEVVSCLRKQLTIHSKKRNLSSVFDTLMCSYADGQRTTRASAARNLGLSPVTAQKTVKELQTTMTTLGYGPTAYVWRQDNG